MRNWLFIAMLLCICLAAGFNGIQGTNLPSHFPKPVYNFRKNPPDSNKIKLGRALFYDPILSKNDQISCASCHSPYNAFAHIDHKLSHGLNDQIGTRNAPPLFNLAWQKTFMWDGAIRHLDVQPLAPISHPAEMGETMAHLVEKLSDSKHYPKAFHKAFGDSIITGQRILRALSQFQLTLVSDHAKYDLVKQGKARFNLYEEKGYAIFLSKCNQCHTEPLFTNGDFENNGLKPDSVLRDDGRIKITLMPSDSLKFKVPSLRNVEFTFPYMHDGRYDNLQMVLFHYSNNIYPSKTLSAHLQKPMQMSEADKQNLVAFLKTLTDESFIRNQKNHFPKDFFGLQKK